MPGNYSRFWRETAPAQFPVESTSIPCCTLTTNMRVRTIVPLFFALAVLVSAQDDTNSEAGTCINKVRTQAPRSNSNCGWYNDYACCTQYDTLGYDYNNVRDSGCAGPIDGRCTDYIILTDCALACSPNITSTMVGTTPQIQICSSLADTIWKKCKYSSVKEWTKGVCVALNTVFDNSTDFVENSLNMIYYNGTDTTQCWNAAVLAAPSLVLLFGAFFALLPVFLTL
ncbi:hypothetical protein PROFUN_09741 [Planoprotostelium fungivorum]|uniref:Folate receptor-like domain-containing protein n=1 Tax=Planoprotostelium fungivorum TaxID=1890364 RepID=A0A2P6NF93_9EUKA|nr:hypothetical protein PROFUN_09741 [Planoprotostelium fungivorum]